MEGGASSDYFTSQKYSLIRARQLEAKIGERGLIKDSAAELPPINVLFTPVPPNLKANYNRQQFNSLNASPPPAPAASGSALSQPVTATGQPTPASQPQAAPAAQALPPAVQQPQSTQPPPSGTPVAEPVTVTGQPVQSATAEQQPPAGNTEERKPDVTGLPDIKLE
jgi:cytoskeletal protein RodZ